MSGGSKIFFTKCKIHWDIEDFCLVPDGNYIILSPEFILYGISPVKWRMSLELEYDDLSRRNLVSFYLEKLTISEPVSVRASYEVTFGAGITMFFHKDTNVEFREHCKHGKTGIATTDEILENILPLKSDTLNITLYLVAYTEERPLMPYDKPEFGILLLSNDLERLRGREKNYADIKLKVKGSKPIEAHKAILSRNERFKNYFQNTENDVIEIPNIDYKSLDDFINYIYSGNAKYLLRDPSISSIKCVEHFNCDVLNNFYVPEEFTVSSKFKVEEHEFHWTIPDIADKNNFVVASEPIQKFNVSTTWKLTISLRSDDPNNFISIFAEIIAGDKPSYFCLEFAIISDAGLLCFGRRLLRKNQNYDNMGFHDFVKRDSLFQDAHLTEHDCVRIMFRVRTSNGSHETLMGSREMSLNLPTEAPLYKHLSSYMAELLIQENYSDIDLKCENKIIKAHKCILVARSPGFRRLIENAPPGASTLVIEGVEFDILRIIITYIYTGNSDELRGEKVDKILEASLDEKLDIPSLKEFLKNNRS